MNLNFFRVGPLLLAVGLSSGSVLASTCDVYVGGQHTSKIGIVGSPKFIHGKSKEGKSRTFRVWAREEKQGLRVTIADNDKILSHGSFKAAAILGSALFPKDSETPITLKIGDDFDVDPSVQVDCAAEIR
jgi:hypothetical protein